MMESKMMHFKFAVMVYGLMLVVILSNQKNASMHHPIRELDLDECGSDDKYYRNSIKNHFDNYLKSRQLVLKITLLLAKKESRVCRPTVKHLPRYGSARDNITTKAKRLYVNKKILENYLNLIESYNFGEHEIISNKMKELNIIISQQIRELKKTVWNYKKFCDVKNMKVSDDINNNDFGGVLRRKANGRGKCNELSIIRRDMEDLKLIYENFIGDIYQRLKILN